MDVPFINRLPFELLVAITALTPDQSTIFRLATVCRHWHDALTGAATLWTSIDCRSESRTSILLQRSKSSPIDVTVDRSHYVLEAVSLVASQTHRMGSIDVTLSYRELEDFYSLLNGPAPILEAMWMQGESYPCSTRSLPLYSSSFQGQFPALRTLCLEDYPFDLAQFVPMMTNGLTKLVLCSQQFHHLVTSHHRNPHVPTRMSTAYPGLSKKQYNIRLHIYFSFACHSFLLLSPHDGARPYYHVLGENKAFFPTDAASETGEALPS